MNLLTDAWIPVRLLSGGNVQTITLQALCCSPDKWRLSMPREDMELAALQLLVCLLQVIAPPEDAVDYRRRVAKPLSEDEYDALIQPWITTFDLEHPDQPFMQIRGVNAAEPTSMDKLLTGVSGSTNCAFINQPGQGEHVCSGCTAIALFNQANNAPGFGGGFKSGLRGGTPMTTLVRGDHLRTTLCLNVLAKSTLLNQYPDAPQSEHRPTWVKPIVAGETIPAAAIGLVRGLFWQPAHIELCPPEGEGQCSACGLHSQKRYSGFNKAKFNFTVEGLWNHPHSPRLLSVNKGTVETKFLAFTTAAPSWTQISRILINKFSQQQGGHAPATVIAQFQQIAPQHKLALIVGGYRNNQASILERRHEVLTFNDGWEQHHETINEIVETGLGYKTALRKALYSVMVGYEKLEIKGVGVPLQEPAERQFYRQSNLLIPNLLATLDYTHPQTRLAQFHAELRQLCDGLFNQAIAPYSHHPKLIAAIAMGRKTLRKQFNELRPQGGKTDD